MTLSLRVSSITNCACHATMQRKTICAWPYLNKNAGEVGFWMAQQYIQSLDHIGQWRVLLVGGGIISIMHTHKTTAKDGSDDWAGTATNVFLTLQEIRCVTPHSHHIYNNISGFSNLVEKEKRPIDMAKLCEVIVNPDSGAGHLYSQARTEFVPFVERTSPRELVTHKTRQDHQYHCSAVWTSGYRLTHSEKNHLHTS